MDKPLILITNDDGITSPGIKALIEVAENFGEILVVAPDSPQSGMGHAITVNNVLHCNKERIPSIHIVVRHNLCFLFIIF